MIRDLLQRPFLHERSPDAPEVIVSTPLRFILNLFHPTPDTGLDDCTHWQPWRRDTLE